METSQSVSVMGYATIPKLYSDANLDEWMSVLSLDRDVDLFLTAANKYDANSALRHVMELVTPKFIINVLLSSENPCDKAFTHWLADAKTINRYWTISLLGTSHSMHCMQILSTVRHSINYNFPDTEDTINDKITSHYASFDMHVAGMMERALLDSGATPSCVLAAFAKRMGTYIKPNPHSSKIGGFGGTGYRYSRSVRYNRQVTS